MPIPTSGHSSGAQTTGILVVDDHGLVRDALSTLLSTEHDLHVIGVAENGAEGVAKAIESKPDIVLMDIDMPGLSCFDAVTRIRSASPHTRFILVTAYPHDEHLEQALRVKVNGFVVKHEGLAAVVEAVRNVRNGRLHFSPRVMDRLVVKGKRLELANPPKSRRQTLTPRERELLRVLSRGLSLKAAADVLGVSYKTADKQKASLMAKLDIHNRVDLTRYAIREGLVRP